jgi:hypothetical protein
MSGVVPRFETGPVTYTVAEAVKGGQLVEARAAAKVGVAGAGSKVVLGVATKDALPDASRESTDSFGFPVYNEVALSEFVTVGVGFYPVTYAANASFGEKLKAAAAGKVTPYVEASDTADMIVGYCAEPAGVTSADGTVVGLAKIFP